VEGGGAEDAHVATERVVDVKRRRREVAIRVEVKRHLNELSLAVPPGRVLGGALPADPLVASLLSSSPTIAARGDRWVVLAKVGGSLLAVGELAQSADETVSAGDHCAVVGVVDEVELIAATISLTNVVRYQAVCIATVQLDYSVITNSTATATAIYI